MAAKMKPVIEADPLQGFRRKRSISGTSGGMLLDVPSLGALQKPRRDAASARVWLPAGLKVQVIGAVSPGTS